MDILLEHLERTGEHMPQALRKTFVQSFFPQSGADGDECVFETGIQQDLVLDKAARILTAEGFQVHSSPDYASGVVKAEFQKTYGCNEGFLATVDRLPGSPLTLSFGVEVWSTKNAGGQTRVKTTRRLASWAREFRAKLLRELDTLQPHVTKEQEVQADVVLGPGEKLTTAFTGSLLDYSSFATKSEVAPLVKRPGDGKALPLGVYAFDLKPGLAAPDELLSLGFFGSKPMEFNGTLIVAPQNSGKTRLILRWAAAANHNGYNLFLVDVKGNLLPELRSQNLQGKVHFFTTDPNSADADEDGTPYAHFNILEDLDPTTPVGRNEIKTLCEAILPEFGGEDDRFRPIRVKWLAAMICLRKLHDLHYRRLSDLGDIYEMATNEKSLYDCILDVFAAETYQREANAAVKLPEPGAKFWANELAEVIDRESKDLPGGQRESRYTYSSLTVMIGTALAPFYKYGALHQRTHGRSDFRLSDLNGAEQTTIILAAREHDGEEAKTVVSIFVKRLEQILKRRFAIRNPDRRILLLLDETRRIRGFSPGQYVTFAREAKAGCVLVYQSINQIKDASEVTEILENVGTQIYLRSVTGSTAENLLEILPQRFRPAYSRSTSTGSSYSVSSQVSQELVPCAGQAELYKLPAGGYPALVFIKDFGTGKPFLVDMSEDRLAHFEQAMSN